MLFSCVIPGRPVGKGRPRVTTRGGFARAYTPPKTAHWEGVAATILHQQWAGAAPLDWPLVLVVRAVGERPKRLMRKSDPAGRMYRTAKPDGDNVLKAVADGLVKAGVVRDDVLIVEWRCTCLYAAKDEGPSVELELYETDDPGHNYTVFFNADGSPRHANTPDATSAGRESLRGSQGF